MRVYIDHAELITRATGIIAWVLISVIAWKTAPDGKLDAPIGEKLNISFFAMFFQEEYL